MRDIVLKPRLSEKAYGVSQASSVYVFTVPLTANKHTVARAVATQYGVTVESVNVLVVKGKAVRSYRKRSRAVSGKRANLKKAYVTLKSGESLPIFESEETAKETKTKKTSKASAKETK